MIEMQRNIVRDEYHQQEDDPRGKSIVLLPINARDHLKNDGVWGWDDLLVCPFLANHFSNDANVRSFG